MQTCFKIRIRERQKFEELKFSGDSSLTPKQKMKLVELIGPTCTIDCMLDGVKTESLWETGAAVTAVGDKWVEENFLDKEITDVSVLLWEELFLKIANNSKMDYVGYTEMVLMMSDTTEPLFVPFLVIPEVTMSITGNNVIKEVVEGELNKNNNKAMQNADRCR